MKYLGVPKYDDFDIIRRLSKKDNLASYPLLEKSLKSIESEYTHYKNVAGDGTKLNQPLALANALKEGLKADYGRKLKDLSYIAEIRSELSPDVCPMCGSFAFGQVDHLIPKTLYPEFSLFSHNLVPACGCNQSKSSSYMNASGARIFHPYYDKELQKRISYIAFSGDVSAPSVEVELARDFMTNESAKFHVQSIIRKTNILNWAGAEWAKIVGRPRKTVFSRLTIPVSARDFTDFLQGLFLEFDDEYGTPNNWKSMFYYGLALADRFHAPIRKNLNSSGVDI
ncbi:HNH endonuclease [Telluria beijingensis]|uniref:HNH endonuclease n=1 Tax=Telluria beijingensis TaxID=3068633 RepID=UPI0027952327|nr:hypothetical protein [Massilia sp. REN29]